MAIIYNNNFEAGKIIVAVNKRCSCFDKSVFYMDQVLEDIDFEKIKVIFKSKKVNDKSNIGEIILVHLRRKDELSVINAIEKLSTNPYVIYVEPDYLFDVHIIPNDQYFKYLWGMEKIKATDAWNYTTGSDDVVVGVVDSGIDHNHRDIKENMWVSPNGQYINGWNFVDNNGNSMDKTGHGTHVAGTIGAVGNNYIGIVGVCWKVKIASLKIGDFFMKLDAIIEAINFANENNIPILNNSWGGRFYSPILRYAIEQYDGLFIVSAGNDGTNNDLFPDYPSSYDSDNIISVASNNPDNTLASFSNYGSESVDIAAPGTGILSLSLNNKYIYRNGTSMSAPYVAGAAALLKAYMPNLTTLEIKNILLSSATKYCNLDGKILTGGILNVNAMFEMANRLA